VFKEFKILASVLLQVKNKEKSLNGRTGLFQTILPQLAL